MFPVSSRQPDGQREGTTLVVAAKDEGGFRRVMREQGNALNRESLKSLRRSSTSRYSQRNTFAESAVHTANTAASAATSPKCARHGSPFQIPSSSDTA